VHEARDREQPKNKTDAPEGEAGRPLPPDPHQDLHRDQLAQAQLFSQLMTASVLSGDLRVIVHPRERRS
jgi:hypothetical protein